MSKPIWWLESRFHFNFADYYNSENTNFGALKVLNDDLIQPKAGFGFVRSAHLCLQYSIFFRMHTVLYAGSLYVKYLVNSIGFYVEYLQ